MSKIKIMFDADGVIANFDKSIKDTMQLQPELKSLESAYYKAISTIPEFRNLSGDEIKKKLSGEQTDSDLKALKRIVSKYNSIKYSIANKEGFFINLEMMPQAREMLIKAYNLTGVRPSILTAPMTSNSHCEREKKEWCEKYLSDLYEDFLCTTNKFSYASPNTILIDDRIKYIKPFEEAGGIGILFHNPQQAMEELENWVELIKLTDN